jgi:acyl dehydratase
MAVRELQELPGMNGLYARAVSGTGVAVLGRLPGLGGGRDHALPELELVINDVAPDERRVADYERVCQFEPTDSLPPTYPHVLAFPLAMRVMTDGAFPFPVIGLVHIANRITQRRPIARDEPLSLRVTTDALRPHDRGTQFDIVTDVSAGGEHVWEERSTYLHREHAPPESRDKKRRRERRREPDMAAEWAVPDDIGRRYAAVSGDRNPIHLHRLTAVAFGMGRPIAHGMWLKARCLAALGGELPQPLTVEVDFKLPLSLPARVAFRSWPERSGRGFSVHDAKGEKPHMSGRVASR